VAEQLESKIDTVAEGDTRRTSGIVNALILRTSACHTNEVPGDTHRNLEVHSIFSALAYKNALLPVWVAAYDYKGKPYRFLVNGVTGKCHGTAPWSWIKVTLLVMAILTFVLIVLFIAGQGS